LSENTIRFSIWPNPTERYLNLEFEQIQSAMIQIKDLNGKVIILENMAINSSYLLDISSLSSGMYLLEVENDLQKSIVRFIKQ
jgi:hypothetical protein